MAKYVSVAEMVAIEREANSRGLTYEHMMEYAGNRLAEATIAAYSHVKDGSAIGLVGSGNNGGDTLVALAYMAKQGWKTSAYIVRSRNSDDPLISEYLESGGNIFTVDDDADFKILTQLIFEHAILIDGILGTGIKLPLRGKVQDVLVRVKEVLEAMDTPPKVVAVDCPSGVDCDSGEVADECISADLTVTMAAIKAGLFKFPAYGYVGKLELVGIGLPDDISSLVKIKRVVPEKKYIQSLMPKRPLDAHKGTFGTALVVAGSVNYTGAALLAGEAAYRVGSGLVTLAVPYPLHGVLAGQFPEATWLLLPHETGVIAEDAAEIIFKNLGQSTAMLVGPGFGLENTTRNFLSCLIENGTKTHKIGFVKQSEERVYDRGVKLPSVILDADGLKLLVQIPNWERKLPAPAVLTPHPGEMSLMTGLHIDEIQSRRVEVAEEYAQKWGHIVVLKGAFTVVASPDGRTAIISVASPALARAGTGDVLAGLIVGLRAQGVEAFESAVVGAWLHAQGGLQAAEMVGSSTSVVAGDVLKGVIKMISELS